MGMEDWGGDFPTYNSDVWLGPGENMDWFGGGGGGWGGWGGWSLPQLLTILGGGGLGMASLFGGNPSQTYNPRLSPWQQQFYGAGQGAFGQAGGMQGFMDPMQRQLYSQGTGLLSQLGSGGGIPPAISRLVEQAYQPQIGDVASRAIESARQRGFAGGADLLQGGPAGAIAGPALANLPGAMAQTKLNLMFPLISALMGGGQQGFQNYMSLGQGQAGAGQGMQTPYTQTNEPSWAQRIGGLLPMLGNTFQIAHWMDPAYRGNNPYESGAMWQPKQFNV